jgi:hypothetical protein
MDAQKLNRIYVSLTTEEQWYSVMRECRAWFGKNWRTQGRIKRKLAEGSRYSRGNRPSVQVWFEVPDLRFATWISVKMSLQVAGEDKIKAGK